MDVAKAVQEVKAGKIDLKLTKLVSYMLELGFFELSKFMTMHTKLFKLIKLKPTAAKVPTLKVFTYKHYECNTLDPKAV
jgi:hypothetical protein